MTTPTPAPTFRLILDGPPNARPETLQAWAIDLVRRLRGYTFNGTGTGGGGVDAGEFVKLLGRPGGQVVYGGTGSGDTLILHGNTVDPSSDILVGQTGDGEGSMLVGGDIDPLQVLFGQRLMQFCVESDGNMLGVGALFGAWTAATLDGPGAAPNFFGMRSRGTRAAPTATQDGDYLFLLAGFGWPFGQPSAQITIRQHGASVGGQAPGSFRVAVSDTTGPRNIFVIGPDGLTTFADPHSDIVHDTSMVAQVHIRASAAGIVGQVVQPADTPTANLSEWWSSGVVTLAADLHNGDTTITLVNSTTLPSTGTVVNVLPQGPDSIFPYSANNTGTGVLTLVAPAVIAPIHGGSLHAGSKLRGLQVLPIAVVLPNGAFRFAHLADSAAANDTWYYSTTANKAVYKDSGGVVNSLY